MRATTIATKGEPKRSNINSIHKIYIPTVIVCKQLVIVQKKKEAQSAVSKCDLILTDNQWHPVRYTVNLQFQ